MSKMVSIRIDEETLSEAKKLNINISKVLRELLKKEIERRKNIEMLESLSEIQKILKNVDRKRLLEDLRGDRDERDINKCLRHIHMSCQ
jgi:post-segregation antitoxin (ccd killing protein)